jgi:hypothetical protein
MQYNIYLHISITTAFNIHFKYEIIKNELWWRGSLR